MDALGDMISNVGFPIVMCLLLFYQFKAQTRIIDKLENTLSTMVEKIEELAEDVKNYNNVKED